MKTKLPPLERPDRKRCQAEKREGTFMTLGGSPHRLTRCSNAPVVIAHENNPGSDGRKGSMSLCAKCKSALLEQCGSDFATFNPISP